MRQPVRKTQLCHLVMVDHLGKSGTRAGRNQRALPSEVEASWEAVRHTSQMSDSQALTEFDMVTVQGQTGLSPRESETVTSYTVSAVAADLS